MYTVGRLAKKHGLSRSTLLYYDRIGLLRPDGHAKGEYRQYSAQDHARLTRICEYRRAGISLDDIARMLDEPAATGMAEVLENRLTELNREMDGLREQQRLVAGLLGRSDLLNEAGVMDKATWVSLLSAAGFSEQDMRRWHVRFERSAPDKHAQFLRSLHIPDGEISAIRAMAAAPHAILNINRESGRFMEIFFKIYEGLDREGPGSFEMTKRAYEMCTGLPDKPEILEIGCGSGGATIPLAQISGGIVTATELHHPYLERMIERAKEARMEDRIIAAVMDMGDIRAEPESFDLIWCEGAAYILGVDRALEQWKQYLKPGGCLCLTDAVWLVDPATASEELRSFWAEGYPAMRDAKGNIRAGEGAGYASLGNFTISTLCWDNFYNDVERRLADIEPVYGTDPDGRAIIDMTRKEISLYRNHPHTYGYEFHIFKK
ncbi:MULTISPECIES: MerR family transcriptional regulator [unclassified Pseudodesulfovibrio]|uniref:MerR family transcriptional regulator n=1 Tax=unclassified Pseudodesulfovibrio TaxID=2661612 RepID=UPI000FEBE774|nr:MULTISPECIES: MerR family transcriptional regulator [unclassified Pseudodesulfovibrio]MCJ2166184.1 MerR family transcriptional regulator [Pseudodesulfovibrio sp. S3-i]RWU02350.1 methyltransferase domain-containing protein [Pseudodesulfovibrio sp. S3]